MLRMGWYKIIKSFRGGEYRWRLRVTKALASWYTNENELVIDIGESTDGGKENGFSIKSRFYGGNIPKDTDILSLKPVVVERWVITPDGYRKYLNKKHAKIRKQMNKRLNSKVKK